jgi:kinesin family protein 18/19
LIDGLLEGYNASVLAYGATSCGKTFTYLQMIFRMVGEKENKPGIMAMAVLELLNKAQLNRKYQNIKLKASYM